MGALLLVLLLTDWITANYRWQKEGFELLLFIIFYFISGYLSEKFFKKQ